MKQGIENLVDENGFEAGLVLGWESLKTIYMTHLDQIKITVCKMAGGHGWRHIKTQPYCLNFEKGYSGDPERVAVNVYWNASVTIHKTFTVQTALHHPKKGAKQLNRKGIDFKMLDKIFENPRIHTGKGYY